MAYFILLFVVYFLISDIMRRSRTFCWKEYRGVVADLPCFVASRGGAGESRAAKFPRGLWVAWTPGKSNKCVQSTSAFS